MRAVSRVGGRWAEPVTIAESDRFFVNWADFASITETTTGSWVVHWLEKTIAKAYAYHVKLAISKDRGRSWSAPVTIHSDTSATEHGFAAMVPLNTGAVAVAWLDGRQMTEPAGAMSVRTAIVNPDGSVSPETTLDARSCECCQVSMAAARAGLVVVYRDRSDQEIRDIAIVRQTGATWSAPAPVANDGWLSRQCPVNGPSIAALGEAVGVAWFTAANRTAKVNVALSADGGKTFGKPIRVDQGNPL
ncbi:MAG: exo-alpha-sialidase, partial [Rhodanobacter sp.]